MRDKIVFQFQRLYPQIYLACHVEHIRSSSTEWRLSARDSSILAHLDSDRGTSPRTLATHLNVAPSTLSATIARLVELGYISSGLPSSDRRQRELRLTKRGAEAMASTSVLDSERLRELVDLLDTNQRRVALEGFQVLAHAARRLGEQR